MTLSKVRVSTINRLTDLATINYVGSLGERQRDIIVTQPYVGRGWGIRVGVEEDSLALVADTGANETYIVGYFPDQKFHKGVPAEQDSGTRNSPRFKELNEGEIVLQSMANSQVFLGLDGEIMFSTSDGNYFKIDKEHDTIASLCQNQIAITESTQAISGLVRRDIRNEKEKIEDLYLEDLINLDYQSDFQEIIGVDPQHRTRIDTDVAVGLFDPQDKASLVQNIPGLKNIPQVDTFISAWNPALTEHRLEISEFSDGLQGIQVLEQNDKSIEDGRLPISTFARVLLGTAVNARGKIERFDYCFSNPKGHQEIWKIPGINEKQQSSDFKIDKNKALGEVGTVGNQFQWTVSDLDHFNTSTGFQLLLNTRGADSSGQIPNQQVAGSLWGLQVDKEGLTKWNIPAATSLNDKELYREGRSLLWNLDGSITQSIGRENSFLPNITGLDEQTEFINITKERIERSITLDCEGSIEERIGADSAGQSLMIEADGSLAFYLGKHNSKSPSVCSDGPAPGLSGSSTSGKRTGTSIAGRTEGSIELDIGADTGQTAQSLAVNTKGVVRLSLGENSKKESFTCEAAGGFKWKTNNGGHIIEVVSAQSREFFNDGIRIQHGGPTQSVIQIDKNGVIALRNSLANSNIIMSKDGDINMVNATGSKFTLAKDGTISIGSGAAGIEISPTAGIILRVGGNSFSLSPTGKAELAVPIGFTITGGQTHINTSTFLIGAGAGTSPFRVQVCGGGLGLDPLTGLSETGYPLLGVIG